MSEYRLMIGVLSLECPEANAFNDQDEKLLVVIASQVAGMIEHMRLISETQIRADNLQRINEIIQQVVGVNQVEAIASRAAELMAEKFGYEIVLVMLLDEEMDEFVAEGVGGVGTKDFPKGLRYSSQLGIPGEVLRLGESIRS